MGMQNDETEERTWLALNAIAKKSEDLKEAKANYDFRKNIRDFAIIGAIRNGISMYTIAKHAGISQQAVRKIRDNNQENK